jgi:3-deoxy-manno-octulosonate cytidylyltransferase (CMP-KDO synthetase)
MDAIVIIPARFASTRLPGKPILERVREVTGKYLIQHVCERAAQAPSVRRVIVATDDERIADAVRGFGGDARMTSTQHRSGTDRIAEIAAGLDAPIVVNVQGDEPDIQPEQIEQVIQLLATDTDAMMSTLASPIDDEAEWLSPANVKVVVGADGSALYFSRAPIPHIRDVEGLPADAPCRPLQHLGIYAYRRAFLLGYADLPASALEESEKLEQLRALAAGHRILVGITQHRSIGIDTPEDLEAWLAGQLSCEHG